jgi:hypothetical protein
MVDEREISPIDDRQLVTQEVEGLGQTLSLLYHQLIRKFGEDGKGR